MDVEKQVAYWRKGAFEDIEAAEVLLANGKIRHGLFFAHMALEKLLKAHITRATADVPPRTHNLVRLASLSAVEMPPARRAFLDRFDIYQLEGRYPELQKVRLDQEGARRLLSDVKELLEWLTKQL